MSECLLALGREEESRLHFGRAADLLGGDSWLVAKEPERLARLRELGVNISGGNICPQRPVKQLTW